MKFPIGVLMKTDRLKEGVAFYDTETGSVVYMSLEQIKRACEKGSTDLAGVTVNSSRVVKFKSTFRQLGTIGGGSEDSVTVIKRLIGPSSIQFEIVDTIGNLRMVTKDELIELHKTKRIAGVKFVGDKMFVANEVETFIGKN